MSSPNLLSERIDFLRGAFSIQVLVAHALGQALLHPASYDKSDPLIRILTSTLGLGYLGVTGFFILSGYCIHLSLRSNVRKGGTVKKYVAARASRILPMFFVGLLVAIICEVAMRGMIRPDRWPLEEPLDSATAFWNQLWPSFISLQGVFGTFGSYEPSWTISFEVIYYAVWPLFFYGIARRREDRMGLTLTVSYLVCLTWMVGGFGLWIANGRPADSVLLKFWNIPYGMLTWLFGVVLLMIWKPGWEKLARRFWLPVGGVFLIVTFVLAWNGSSQIINFLKLPLQLLAFGLLLMVN